MSGADGHKFPQPLEFVREHAMCDLSTCSAVW